MISGKRLKRMSTSRREQLLAAVGTARAQAPMTTTDDLRAFVNDIASLTDEQLTYETPMIGSFRDEARRLLKHLPIEVK